MDNQTVITARDIKEILKSLKSDEELVIDDEGIKSLRKKIKYENRCCRNSIG